MTIKSALIVDDSKSARIMLQRLLEKMNVITLGVESAEEALEVLSEKIDLLVTDLRMEGMDGMALFKQVQRLYPQLPVVIITAHGSIPEAVTATQQGVFGFLTKPIDRDQLMQNIEAALASTSRSEGEWRNNIISRSQTMEQLLQEAEQIAGSDVSVLITGASGSGKELLANAIHKASSRCKKPFIAINCGALPEQLLESELFGHSKGAFTGAVNKHEGLFQAANGGTLFLDEIGDMPTPLQVKLLRVLQERHIRPVGSTETIAVDVRVISATHRDLEQAMQDKSFREDLVYRLNGVNLHLPPLKDRPEDIPPLARYFVEQAALRHNPKVKSISSAALQVLAQASWPGNVRQLENIIEKVTALSNTPIISDTAIHRALANQEQVIANFNDARAEFEKRYLCKVLQITEGNVTQAAKIAGRNRTDFYKLLKKHALEASDYKSDE